MRDRTRQRHTHELLSAAALLIGCADGETASSATDTAASASEGTSAASTTATSTSSGDTSDASGTSGSSGDATSSSSSGGSATTGDGTSGGETSTTTGGIEICEPDASPIDVDPCGPASCWSTLTFSAICGPTALAEDYASGAYNVHHFVFSLHAGVPARITFTRTGGDFDPALIIRDAMGDTLFDGEAGVCSDELKVEVLATGVDGDTASVELSATSDRMLDLFLSGWHVVDGGFAPAMPTDATYTFEIDNLCAPETGASDPPNFDEGDVEGGYFVLPDSEPPGLYTHKDPDCSRGTRRMIQVLTTVARRWQAIRPELAPISFLDINEAWCSNVNHSTHDDGTHADLMAGCATNVSCANWIPAYDLARLFVDTGEVCGILFNDAKVQGVVNPYFEAGHDYEPWKQLFMRTVDGHVVHFHVRVKKPDGTCN
ncbi:MAG: hypothetical protein KC420_12365 [Myxococcales bacterium]|nr:hypothetical protein [Myxococcales bacterium]MCB9706907.1 hypothetical protein [Myxococcales bacterium]